jgi:hypothetical protein
MGLGSRRPVREESVNYHPLKWVAFHRRLIDMYNTQTKIVTWTQKPVYRDLPIGKLERSRLVESMLVPHQQGFNCNSKARLTVAVHHLTTDTLEKTVVATMPTFSHSTAVTTPFAGVVGIDNVECDILVEAPCFEVHPELVERNTQNLTIELLRLGVEPFEVFNTNVSIVFECEVGDVTDNLTNTVLDEVPLVMLGEPEFLPSILTCHSDGLQSCSVSHASSSTSPNILPVVELFENLPLRGEYADCETLAVHINTDHILPSRQQNILFAKIGNDLPIRSESISLTHPTTPNQRSVPLVVPILDNRNWYVGFGLDSQTHEEPALSIEGLTVSGLVELDCDMGENFALGFADTTLNVTDYLTIEGGVVLDN